MGSTKGRIAAAFLATVILGTVFCAALLALAIIGRNTTITTDQIAPFSVISGILATVILWLTLAVLFYEIAAARQDNRMRGTAIPTFLGGLLAIVALAFLSLLYRALFYALRLIGLPQYATLLADPLVVAALNVIILLFAVAAFVLVANAPVRAVIRATAARWKAKRSGGTEFQGE